ncbi:peptide ligase PGM1-related protein [Streptomyces sp. NPDC057950]|uniref:preATP grasp domain-containing protein n=1 Tax=Streptomyces sp. NPDC057950 TaxID=3346288 RepID=UPI0036EF9043
MIIFANLFSDLAVDLDEEEQLVQWAQQAPREAWLLRVGDVLVSPVPVSRGFVQYVHGLTGVPPDRVTIIEVPWVEAVPLADAVRKAGSTELLGLAGQSDAVLLPTALDVSAVDFAREMGFVIRSYATVEDAAAAVEVAKRLNTKSGFRQVADELGIRLPEGRACRRSEVPGVVRNVLEHHERAVVKPDRSAGGHGMCFVSRRELEAGTALELDAVGGPTGSWVVEECVDLSASVSVQLENLASGTRVLFSGTMRVQLGSFTGYLSPLTSPVLHAVEELERWGLQLGAYLAEHGYMGPFGLDALVSTGGTVYASESNVRRTATTTPHEMVSRLTAGTALTQPAWSMGTGRTSEALCFDEALARLLAHRLGFEPESGGGVVLYGGPSRDGRSWRYVVIGASAEGVREQETALAAVLGFVQT